jgi:hypothetical protein
VAQLQAQHHQRPLVTNHVDGGVALVSAPYDGPGWATVREGWWWHVLAMVAFPPYAVVALVVWQRPSGQPLVRRLAWAVLATLGALLLVGLGAFVLFARRWYWWHRAQAEVEAVATAPPAGGPLAQRAAEVGAAVIDAVCPSDRRHLRPGLSLAWIPAPWGPLRDQVAAAAVRVQRVAPHGAGPAADVVARSATELRAAFEQAVASAGRAAQAERLLRTFDEHQAASDLDVLATSPGDPVDLELARRSVHAQRLVVQRVAASLAGTEGRLRRLAAQAGEVAARAEELVWAPGGAAALEVRGLDAVTDQLAAVRSALDELDQLEVVTGAA